MTPQQKNDFPIHPTPPPTLESVIAQIEERLPNWRWLVRNDETHGAFANLINRDNLDSYFPTYATDKVAALGMAFNRAVQNIAPRESIFYAEPN